MWSNIRAAIWLGILGGAIYVAYQALPPHFHNLQFQDAMSEEARLDSVNPRVTEDEIRGRMYQKARECSIPVTADEIHVQKDGGQIMIWTDYTVHVDIPVKPFDIDFHPQTDNVTQNAKKGG